MLLATLLLAKHHVAQSTRWSPRTSRASTAGLCNLCCPAGKLSVERIHHADVDTTAKGHPHPNQDKEEDRYIQQCKFCSDSHKFLGFCVPIEYITGPINRANEARFTCVIQFAAQLLNVDIDNIGTNRRIIIPDTKT